MTSTTTTRTEKVYVLYGSQTGNSEEAAITFCEELPTKLSPTALQTMTGTADTITLQPKHMQLDDFLELRKADWTRLLVIFVSSYGVGQAPLGSYRFRDLCDAWKEDENNGNNKRLLDGVHFALCGLGDSSYPTFFQNPTALYEGLEQVGATRIGEIGKADATKTGDDAQDKVIARWKESIWQPLAQAAVKPPLEAEQLQEMQRKTIELCAKINPDFVNPNDSSSGSTNNGGVAVTKRGDSPNSYLFLIVVPVLMAIVGIVAVYFLK